VGGGVSGYPAGRFVRSSAPGLAPRSPRVAPGGRSVETRRDAIARRRGCGGLVGNAGAPGAGSYGGRDACRARRGQRCPAGAGAPSDPGASASAALAAATPRPRTHLPSHRVVLGAAGSPAGCRTADLCTHGGGAHWYFLLLRRALDRAPWASCQCDKMRPRRAVRPGRPVSYEGRRIGRQVTDRPCALPGSHPFHSSSFFFPFLSTAKRMRHLAAS
jgi:hypothetical protein